MVAPLVIAAIGLAKQKLDEDQEQYAGLLRYQEAAKEAAYRQKADIMAMRAARAGDSGYMQRAMGSALNFPKYNPPQQDNSGALLRVAGGLAAQGEADGYESEFKKTLQAQQAAQQTAAAVPAARTPDQRPIAWAGPDEEEWSSFGSWG